ncbi:hypothetical protein ONS95_012931 [Cadophora gregata]|uniref:uncharacterized protein n=1 Tax=Cadophora gregata TaxID=51156 RepID=UPI0026DA8039|nr:uncharacterized protein ONS95_012931 [Cadophora gregata]KAK0101085.1 hypothetical protein ONS96_006312 [Cadophora gregata f. sp. sojae]KAK0115884.1 hypothetical protein ONS95_012931 [Cadophora gregata]
MRLQSLAMTFGLVAIAAGIETHGSPPVDFEVRLLGSSEPLTTPIKDSYEIDAACIAYDRIKSTDLGKQCAVPSDKNLADKRNAVYALKDCIIEKSDDERIFFDLLSKDIKNADKFWSKVVKESDKNLASWIAARANVKAYYGSTLTAIQFAGWTLSPFADAANLHGNPEHYYKSTPSNATDTHSEILEGWGGVTSKIGMQRTHFNVPSYAIPSFNNIQYPASWDQGPQFLLPLQRAGLKQLMDGTTFGVLHIAVRDLSAAEVAEAGKAGIEIYSAVWYPAWEGASRKDREEFGRFLQDEAEHMVVEIVNLTLQARKDLSPK